MICGDDVPPKSLQWPFELTKKTFSCLKYCSAKIIWIKMGIVCRCQKKASPQVLANPPLCGVWTQAAAAASPAWFFCRRYVIFWGMNIHESQLFYLKKGRGFEVPGFWCTAILPKKRRIEPQRNGEEHWNMMGLSPNFMRNMMINRGVGWKGLHVVRRHKFLVVAYIHILCNDHTHI